MLDKMIEWLVRIAFVVVAVLVSAILAGFVVYFLWNYLMPDLFGLPTLSLVQAILLSILARALFGEHS